MKGIEDEAEDFQRHDAEEWLRVARMPEDDRRVRLAVWQRDVALGDRSADGRAVGEGEVHLPFRDEADRPPHVVREQGVDRAAVDQEAAGCSPPGPRTVPWT